MSSRLALTLAFAALLAAATPARADTVLSLNGSAELSVAGDALDNRLTLTFTDIAPSGWATAVIVEDNPDGRLTASAGSSCEVGGEGPPAAPSATGPYAAARATTRWRSRCRTAFRPSA